MALPAWIPQLRKACYETVSLARGAYDSPPSFSKEPRDKVRVYTEKGDKVRVYVEMSPRLRDRMVVHLLSVRVRATVETHTGLAPIPMSVNSPTKGK